MLKTAKTLSKLKRWEKFQNHLSKTVTRRTILF